MKRAHLTLLICFVTAVTLAAHEPGRDHATLELGTGKVTIDYGTPDLGDRNLDDMIVAGQTWRLGMNAATTLETSLELDFGGTMLKPGKYTLLARPDQEKKWSLIISTSSSPKDAVVEAPMEFERAGDTVKILKIQLTKAGDGGAMSVAWGNYRLRLTFKAVS